MLPSAAFSSGTNYDSAGLREAEGSRGEVLAGHRASGLNQLEPVTCRETAAASGLSLATGALRGVKLSHAILIIDHESEVADTFARVLKRQGFDCLLAYESAAALTVFDCRRPALVLCDVDLPAGDGYEIARHVRRMSPETPVILVSTHDTPRTLERIKRDGAVAYLCKPFSNAELTHTVKSLLKLCS